MVEAFLATDLLGVGKFVIVSVVVLIEVFKLLQEEPVAIQVIVTFIAHMLIHLTMYIPQWLQYLKCLVVVDGCLLLLWKINVIIRNNLEL